jgi:hypothetical protein
MGSIPFPIASRTLYILTASEHRRSVCQSGVSRGAVGSGRIGVGPESFSFSDGLGDEVLDVRNEVVRERAGVGSGGI